MEVGERSRGNDVMGNPLRGTGGGKKTLADIAARHQLRQRWQSVLAPKEVPNKVWRWLNPLYYSMLDHRRSERWCGRLRRAPKHCLRRR